MMKRQKKGPKGSHTKNHQAAQRPPDTKPKPTRRHTTDSPTIRLQHPDSYLLYGRNSVEAALANPARDAIRLFGVTKALDALDPKLTKIARIEQRSDVADLEHMIPAGAPHQGLFLEVRPLPGTLIEDLSPISGQKNMIMMLDQVTDPQNVGACLRSAAAFGARTLITQDRNSPVESGALARASAGGLEVTPWLRVSNLVQALDTLKDMGYWHVGLDGTTQTALKSVDMGDNIVLVMGSEGKGLRPLVRKHCDVIAKIPMTGAIESLNVSNAAAIALYALSEK